MNKTTENEEILRRLKDLEEAYLALADIMKDLVLEYAKARGASREELKALGRIAGL